LISGETIQDSSTAFVARAMIDQIDSLKNTKITNATLSEITTSIRVLVNLCNSKLLSDFPIEVLETPIDNVEFETSSAYYPDLKFSKMKNFVIKTLDRSERVLDDSLCLNAIRVLVNYCNIVVFARFDYGLEIKRKKIDELESSKRLVATSTHLVNGDDSHG
jgi:hypothetical protein